MGQARADYTTLPACRLSTTLTNKLRTRCVQVGTMLFVCVLVQTTGLPTLLVLLPVHLYK
jgi:hypothetical protein